MSIFYRLCPADAHTCSDRRCIGANHASAECPQAGEEKPAAPKKLTDKFKGIDPGLGPRMNTKKNPADKIWHGRPQDWGLE